MTLRDKNSDRVKFNESIKRTLEKLEVKMALMAEWEASADCDKHYLQQLRYQTTKLRAQLKNKGVIFDDEIDF